MAVIYETTMVPTKKELLGSWLPTRSWYQGAGDPVLHKAGGFRLDDPAGEVGIEFVVVVDSSGDQPVAYQVPFTYRGAPPDGADDALVGTSMHGVLGQRWIYDGTRDPVAVAQIVALIAGIAQPQAQSDSGTTDSSVIVARADIASSASVAAQDGPTWTDIAVGDATVVHVNRVLSAGSTSDAIGHVTAPWQSMDGGTNRSVFLLAEGR